MKNSPILSEIAAAIPGLRKSEVKVAEYVLKAPQQVMHMRIVDLAQEAQVSEPTIVRFCRGIGCNGFQEFKVRIAQEMAIANNIGQFAIAEDDSIEDICDKIADTTIQRLHQVKTQLRYAQVAAAANAISGAAASEARLDAGSPSPSQAAMALFPTQAASTLLRPGFPMSDVGALTPSPLSLSSP